MAAAALAGNLAAGGSNIVSSGLTAGLQILGNQMNNQQQQQYNEHVINRAEGAFTEAGLPRYMAYSSNQSSLMPTQKFQIQGGNFYSAGPVNSNLPAYTTVAQQYTHSAGPRDTNNNNRQYGEVRPFNELFADNPMRPLGQNDRQGLGFGRYNLANNFVAGGTMTAANNRNVQLHQEAARVLQ